MTYAARLYSMVAQKLLVRTPESVSFLAASITDKKLQTQPDSSFSREAASIVWAPDGEVFAVVGAGGVTIYDGKTYKEIGKLEAPGVLAAGFSPKATYLSTFQRPAKEAGNADKNLKLWDWRTGAVILQLFQKTFSRDAWPLLQLTADESAVLHQVNNAVNAYNSQDASAGVVRKLGLKGVGGFAVSPDAESPVLAAFVPEGKGIPGYIGLWRLSELDKAPVSPAPFARRSFFRATSAKLFWNAKGTAVLALTASEVDASNKSYYGEQKLHFLAANGGNDCLVPLPKEGPVHDVQWSPSGNHFVTVSGFMPAKTSLFSSSCKLVADLGAGPHNMARWNPQGRFLAVAGFGNLPGDIGLHEKRADGSCVALGACKSEDGVTMEWSPDGRHVLTATIAPRMRVNNGLQIFRYTGELMEEKKIQVLLEARWQPTAPGDFPDAPASPRKKGPASAAPSAAPIRAAGYVPPHVRDSGGTASSSGNFSLAREAAAGSKLGSGMRSRTVVPGAEAPPPAAAAKKSRNRGKGKGKGGEGAEGNAEASGISTQNGAGEAERGTEAENGVSTTNDGVAALSVQGGSDAATDPAKRVRNLRKKLTQIQQLKSKPTGTLEPEQRAKLDSEAAILAELRSLGEST